MVTIVDNSNILTMAINGYCSVRVSKESIIELVKVEDGKTLIKLKIEENENDIDEFIVNEPYEKIQKQMRIML